MSATAAGTRRAPKRESALARWAALVRARREQMDAQLVRLGGPPEDWWAGRSGSFARGIGDLAEAPPFGLTAIADRLGRADTLLDIGAGAGRYAVPLARLAAHVTLVEPSPAMAHAAREAFAAAGRTDYTLLERAWPTDSPATTAVLMANVLAPVEDLGGFVVPALERASEWLFIVYGTAGGDGSEPTTARVIEAFHGEPRVPSPALGDLLPALHELGIFPDVQMGRRRFQAAYADLDETARAVAAAALIEQTPRALRRVRGMLRAALQPIEDGRLALPALDLPVGLLTWRIRT